MFTTFSKAPDAPKARENFRENEVLQPPVWRGGGGVPVGCLGRVVVDTSVLRKGMTYGVKLA